jgi:hypothetical protein
MASEWRGLPSPRVRRAQFATEIATGQHGSSLRRAGAARLSKPRSARKYSVSAAFSLSDDSMGTDRGRRYIKTNNVIISILYGGRGVSQLLLKSQRFSKFSNHKPRSQPRRRGGGLTAVRGTIANASDSESPTYFAVQMARLDGELEAARLASNLLQMQRFLERRHPCAGQCTELPLHDSRKPAGESGNLRAVVGGSVARAPRHKEKRCGTGSATRLPRDRALSLCPDFFTPEAF